METLVFANSIEGKAISWTVKISRANSVHQRAVIASEQGYHPSPAERYRDLELVTELPQMFPPAIRSQVAEPIKILKQNIGAQSHLHLKNLQRLFQKHTSCSRLVELTLEEMKFLREHDDPWIWHPKSLKSFRCHAVKGHNVHIDAKGREHIPIKSLKLGL
jgi:hypothetical protein